MRACALALLAGGGTAAGQITIGAGPWIGTDSAGNSYNEEFQDWTHADCRALDGAGAFVVGGRYNFNDGFDDSRDLIAFYSRDEGDNYYFRADLYDLALNAESGNLDIYVAIDCAPGGQDLDAGLHRRAGVATRGKSASSSTTRSNYDVDRRQLELDRRLPRRVLSTARSTRSSSASREQTLLMPGLERIERHVLHSHDRQGLRRANDGPGEIGDTSDATDTFLR